MTETSLTPGALVEPFVVDHELYFVETQRAKPRSRRLIYRVWRPNGHVTDLKPVEVWPERLRDLLTGGKPHRPPRRRE